VRFYDESVRLYQGLSEEFDYNIMYSVRGHFTLAHTDAAMRTSRWRAEVNKHMGVDSELIYPDEIQRLCPSLNLSDDVRYPILGALYHPPGASRATTRSPGAMPDMPAIMASRSIPTPRSPASLSRTAA
jgi:sarcosine oxidase subunit beta